MDHEKELIVFCDESVSRGKFYSNFYGGLVVGSSQYQRVTDRIIAKKKELNLFGEIKWAKVTERYLEKYVEMIKFFFEEVHAGNVKVRLMFSQNAHSATSLTPDDREFGYFKLYYQFIKHAFGFAYISPEAEKITLRLYFDQFPDTREKAEQFKGYLLALGSARQFRESKISLIKENIAEVRSHEHPLLQCLDVVLGAISFRLNDRHKDKVAGTARRGKRTRAKEDLYRVILEEIRKGRPGFNIGISTGDDGDRRNRWQHPYRHWRFESKGFEFKSELTKRKAK